MGREAQSREDYKASSKTGATVERTQQQTVPAHTQHMHTPSLMYRAKLGVMTGVA